MAICALPDATSPWRMKNVPYNSMREEKKKKKGIIIIIIIINYYYHIIFRCYNLYYVNNDK